MGYFGSNLRTDDDFTRLSSAFTQMIYRVGDSITNPITPMMPYMPLVLSYAQKYDKNMKLGSLLSSLMPYTFALGVVWTLFVIAWYLLGIPLGPVDLLKFRNNITIIHNIFILDMYINLLYLRGGLFLCNPYKILLITKYL